MHGAEIGSTTLSPLELGSKFSYKFVCSSCKRPAPNLVESDRRVQNDTISHFRNYLSRLPSITNNSSPVLEGSHSSLYPFQVPLLPEATGSW